MLPGDRLLAVARLWFDEATIDRVFEPLVADWQRESSTANERRARRVIDLRYRLAAVRVLFTAPAACTTGIPSHWRAFAIYALIPTLGLVATWTALRGVSVL